MGITGSLDRIEFIQVTAVQQWGIADLLDRSRAGRWTQIAPMARRQLRSSQQDMPF